MRLIDADHLRRWILSRVFKTQLSVADVIDQIGREDTIDPERPGKWIHGKELSREMVGDTVIKITYEGWECSECHSLIEDVQKPLWDFCPNCGADMRGEWNDET